MSGLHLIGYGGALLTGLLLGLVGGGGSLLAVPVLVIGFSISPAVATHNALLVVGLTSLIGSTDHIRQGTIHWSTVAWFGIPSLLTVWLTRHWLLLRLPPVLINASSFTLTKDQAIGLFFSLVMMVAALGMIRRPKDAADQLKIRQHCTAWLLSLQGMGVGSLTGWVGAGGGFLIVPGLVILARLPMTVAVGTSLVLVCLNSLVGFISTPTAHVATNYPFLLAFSALSVIGLLLGNRLARRIRASRLRPAFGYFMLLLSVGMFLLEFRQR